MLKAFTPRTLLLTATMGVTFIFFAAFTNPSTFFWLSNPDVQIDIDKDKDKGRYPLTQTTPEMGLRLCNLEPGREYTVFLLAHVRRVNCVPDFVQVDPANRKYGELMVVFTAESTCMDFDVLMSCRENFEPLDYMVSVSKNDVFDKPNSPFMGPDMPPAIVTNSNVSIQNLVTNAIIGGDCFDVSNITATGDGLSNGAFQNGLTSIGFNRGVILSSGNIANATGPNNTPSSGTSFGIFTNDPDLAMISNAAIRDRTILEFDFVPTQDQISFNYVFGSEEYCEYANSGFNDVFGFFLSGPGINGPFSNNAINLALLPNGQGVTINNVNHTSNQAFYVPNIPGGQPNCGGHPLAFPPATLDCQFDGFTVILTATAEVIPCETYHIKLAVADAGDNIYDSAVFLEDNSFGGPDLVLGEAIGGIAGTNIIYEGCDEGCFLFERANNDLSEDLVVNFTLSSNSTATSGADYTPLPSSIVIPAGEASICIPVSAFQDNLPEGQETIIIEIENSCDCETIEVTMIIEDVSELEITLDDQELCGSGAVTLSPGVNGGVPNYTYLWSTGASTPSITVNPSITTVYQVTVTDDCGNEEVEEATVSIIDPPTAELSGEGVVCIGGGPSDVEVSVTFTGSPPWVLVYSINGANQPPVTTSDNPYVFTVSSASNVSLVSINTPSGDCPGDVSGSITITEVNLNVSALANPISCNGEADGIANAMAFGGNPLYTYTWNTGNTGPTITGLAPGTYTVTAVDSEGCEGETMVTVPDVDEVVVAISNVVGVDCNTPNGSASASASGGTPGYSFIWSNGATGPNPSNFDPGTYTVTVYDTNGCDGSANVTIDQDIEVPQALVVPPDIISCTNPEIVLDGSFSSDTGPLNYVWTTFGGNFVSGQFTLTPTVDQGGTYVLNISNLENGCTASATVFVQDLTNLPFTVVQQPQTLTCSITEIDLNATQSESGPNYIIEWTTLNGNIVSGDNSLTPTVNEPGIYQLAITNTINSCVGNATVIVPENVALPDASVSVPSELNCTVQDVQLSGTIAGGPNLSFTWSTSDGNIVSGNNSLNPTVNEPGTYVLDVVNNDNSCINSASIEVEQDVAIPLAVAGDSATITCSDPVLNLDGTGSSPEPIMTYQWSTPDGNIVSGGSTLNPTIDEPGTYTLTVVNQSNTCLETASVIVDIDQVAPLAEAGPVQTINCYNPTLQLLGNNSSNGPEYQYSWTTSDGNLVSGVNTPTPTIDAPGTYEINVLNVDNGCDSDDVVSIDINIDDPVVDAGPGGLLTCVENTYTLQAEALGNLSDFVYSWSTPSGNILSGDSTLSPVVDAQGNYTILVLDTLNGCTASATVFVDQDANLPVALTEPIGVLNCVSTEMEIDASASTQSPNILFEWTTNNGNIVSGENTLNPLIDNPGTYVLTLTDTTNSCVAISSITITPDTLAPVMAILPPNTLTCVVTEIDLTANVTANSPDLGITWSTPDGTFVSGTDGFNPVVSAPGQYELLVVNNNNGCENSTSTIVDQDIVLPNSSIDDPATLTCAVTEISLLATASTANNSIEYIWTTTDGNILGGSDSPTPMVNEPGTYELTVTDPVNGCLTVAQIDVPQDTVHPIADPGATNVLTCAVQTLSLDGLGSSQGNEFVYTWTTPDGNILNGETTLLPEVNEPGEYMLEVFNSVNGCLSSNLVAITQDTVHPVADAGPGSELTCSITDISLQGSGSQGSDIVYQWTTTNGNILNGETTLTPLIDEPGTYELLITNETNSCEALTTVTITEDVDYPITSLAAPDILTCVVTSINLDATGTDSGPLFSIGWSTNDGNIVTGGNSLQPEVNEPGEYLLTVLNTYNNCESTISVEVPQDIVAPDVSAGSSQTLSCAQPTLNLSGAGTSTGPNFEYLWNTANGNILNGETSLQPQIDAPGDYSLLVTNNINGCTSLDQVTVDEDFVDPTVLIASPDLLTCSVIDLQLDATASSNGVIFQYQWSTPDGNILSGAQSPSPTINEPGTYELNIFNSENGCSSSLLVNVDQDVVAPQVDAGAEGLLTCAVTTLNLSAMASGQSGNISLVWSTNNGNIVNGGTTPNPLINEPGTYTLLVTDQFNGCTSSDQVEVDIDVVAPTLLIAPPAILTCAVEEVTINAQGSSIGTIFEVSWTTPNGNILSGANTLMPQIDQPGTYELTILNEDNGCVSSEPVNVSQDIEQPVVDAGEGYTLPCDEELSYLTGSIDNAGPNPQVQWQSTDGSIIGGGNTLNPAINSGGVYSITVLNTVNGCENTDLVEIVENVPENLDVTPRYPPCFGDPGSLFVGDVIGGTPPYVYSIDNGETFQTNTVFQPLPAGNYTVLVQDALGCETSVNIPLPEPPEVIVDLETTVEIQLGDSYQLQALVNFPESTLSYINWTPSESLSCSDCLTPIATPFSTTTYEIQILNGEGCPAEGRVLVFVDERPAIYVPNIFSPNGDGNNDIFMIFAKDESIREIKQFLVFSRWGETVFQYNNFQPNNPAYGWDGRHRGQLLNPAVFVWWAEVEMIDGRIETLKGDVTLVR